VTDRLDFTGRATDTVFFGRNLDLDVLLFRRSRFAMGLNLPPTRLQCLFKRKTAGYYASGLLLGASVDGLVSFRSPGAFNAHESVLGAIRPADGKLTSVFGRCAFCGQSSRVPTSQRRQDASVKDG